LLFCERDKEEGGAYRTPPILSHTHTRAHTRRREMVLVGKAMPTHIRWGTFPFREYKRSVCFVFGGYWPPLVSQPTVGVSNEID